jgi:hypothetical protein
MIILFQKLNLFLLQLLELLINFILFLNKLHNFSHFGLIKYFMHGCITKITKDEWESVKQDNVDIVMA